MERYVPVSFSCYYKLVREVLILHRAYLLHMINSCYLLAYKVHEHTPMGEKR